MTLIHRVEQLHGSTYRFLKTFRARVLREGHETVREDITFFCRHLDREVAAAANLRIGHCHADGVTLRVVLGHADDAGLPIAALPAVDLPARCVAAADSWAAAREQVHAALASA